MAFSVPIRNTDDHLRNHGFLRETTAGWSLAPAFDLNPDPRPARKLLSTAIDERSREARIDTAMDVAAHFRMGEADAKRVLGEVVAATERWRRVAAQRGLDEAAMDHMARVFEHAESERAREILAGVFARTTTPTPSKPHGSGGTSGALPAVRRRTGAMGCA